MINIDLLHKTFANVPQILQECLGHFSQNGEDIAIGGILSRENNKGMFVDIGGYHPFRFSNTFLFYLLGWRGVNIDANPAAIELFKQVRPGDQNLHALVSDRVETLSYFRFEEGAWNTTNRDSAMELAKRGQAGTKLLGEDKLETRTPNQIFEQYVGSKKFDLLNIDVEGLDLRLFTSINFDLYRPKVIAIEIGIEDWNSDPIKSFIQKIGYEVHSQCHLTAILVRKSDI